MSPDKSTIYPEALNSRSCAATGNAGREQSRHCDGSSSRRLPDLIDHADALLAEKARHPDIQLYYPTDTHWTHYGGAIALRQLLAALYPDAHIPPPRMSVWTTTPKMDLLRLLLLRVSRNKGRQAEPLLDRDDQASR